MRRSPGTCVRSRRQVSCNLSAMEEQTAWRAVFRRAAISGSIASLTSTMALSALGKSEIDDSVAPINGPSQWIWGRLAPYRNGFSTKYTAVGYLIHHLASVFWAVLFERWRGRNPPARGSASSTVQQAAATSAMAFLVDYRLTPRRLRPGFEKRLSGRALFGVYAAFALGLALSTRLHHRPAQRTW